MKQQHFIEWRSFLKDGYDTMVTNPLYKAEMNDGI